MRTLGRGHVEILESRLNYDRSPGDLVPGDRNTEPRIEAPPPPHANENIWLLLSQQLRIHKAQLGGDITAFRSVEPLDINDNDIMQTLDGAVPST